MHGDRVLAVTICSAPKTPGGTGDYAASKSMNSVLPSESWARLLDNRRRAFAMLRDSAAEFMGRPIGQIPVNGALRDGPDLGGRGRGLYLPAIVRYDGGFYRALGDPNARFARVSTGMGVRLVILSGLYGLLLPTEPIQEYDYYATWDAGIYGLWAAPSGNTDALRGYIARQGIGLVLDLTGIEVYRATVDWGALAQAGAHVLRAEATLPGDEGLDVLGAFASNVLLDSNPELPEALQDGAAFPFGDAGVRLLSVG